MNCGNSIDERLLRSTTLLVLTVLATTVVVSGVGGATQATDATPTETAVAQEECSPGADEPQLAQARLYAVEETIDTDSPGQIAGGFQAPPTANCPVAVVVTLNVPSGVIISGGEEFTSSGAGLVSARFTVDPGANIRNLRADVFSSQTGLQTVTASIQFWPVGHEDLRNNIDGLTLAFDVVSPTTPSTGTPTASSADGAGGFSVVPALIAAGAGALVLVARGRQ